MWRRATSTPIVSAISRWRSSEASDIEIPGIPLEPRFARRRHVADQRRRGDDGGAGEIAFAAEAHAVLPVAVERGDGALSLAERVRPLPEARPAPRLANHAADRSEDVGDRLARQPRIRHRDLAAEAARSGGHDERFGGARGAMP